MNALRLIKAVKVVAVGTMALILAISGFVRTVVGQASCDVGQYWATYADEKGHRFSHCERGPINYDWGNSGPRSAAGVPGKSDGVSTIIGPDHFHAEWTGRFHFDDGMYTFIAKADDGIKVWVDGVQIINEWRIQAATQFERRRSMTKGEHTLRVEYFEGAEAAVAKFWWEKR